MPEHALPIASWLCAAGIMPRIELSTQDCKPFLNNSWITSVGCEWLNPVHDGGQAARRHRVVPIIMRIGLERVAKMEGGGVFTPL